jgi:hypothetical protein
VATVAGLRLTAESLAGRRNRIGTVTVERTETAGPGRGDSVAGSGRGNGAAANGTPGTAAGDAALDSAG